MTRKLLLLLLLSSFTVRAQNTNVSGTVTDAGGQAWNNGTYSFNFFPSPTWNGNYRQNGVVFNSVPINGSLSATGTFTNVPVPDNGQITPANTKWTITVCAQTQFICWTSLPITITGASQTITSSINPPTILVTCGTGVNAYADSEVSCGIGGQYYNLTSGAARVCTAVTGNACTTWTAAGGGTTSVAVLPATCTSPASVYLSVAAGSNAVGYYDCASNGAYVFRAPQTAWQKVGPVVYGGTTAATAVQEPTVFITPVAQVVTNPPNGAPVLGMFYTLGSTGTTLAYKESLDGFTWFPSAISIAATHLHSCSAISGGTLYILAANAISGANGIDIYSGPNAGALTLLKANIVASGTGPAWKSTSLGNCGFWKDLDGTWRLLYDGYNGSVFQVGEATCTAPSGAMTCTDYVSNPILSNGTGIIGNPKSIKQVSANSYILWPHATPSGVAGALPTDGYFATATSPTGPWTVTTNAVLYRTTAIEGVNTSTGQVADLNPVTFNGSCFMYNTAFPNGNTLVNGAAELSIANTPCESMSSVTQTISNPPRAATPGADGQVVFNSQGAETGNSCMSVILPGSNFQFTVGGSTCSTAVAAINVDGKGGGSSILNVGHTTSAPGFVNLCGTTTCSQLSQSGASGNGTVASNGAWNATAYQTATNCAVNSVSPAACGSAAAGAFVVPTTTTTYTVNTSAVAAASRVIITPRTYAGDLPSAPTCVVPAITAEPVVSALSAGVSFTIAIASTTGQTCWNYWVIN